MMRIAGPSAAPPAPTTPSATTPLTNLRPGQRLEAVALSATHNGQVRLLLGQTPLLARTPIAFTAGQRLALVVAQAGAAPVLRLLQSAPPGQLPSQLQARVLKYSLPQQLQIAPALERLVDLAARTPGLPMSGEMVATSKRLFGSLMSRNRGIDAHALRRAVQNSGLFSESRLARGDSPTRDVKTLLLRLLQLGVGAMPTRAAAPDKTPVPGQGTATHSPQGQAPHQAPGATSRPASARLPRSTAGGSGPAPGSATAATPRGATPRSTTGQPAGGPPGAAGSSPRAGIGSMLHPTSARTAPPRPAPPPTMALPTASNPRPTVAAAAHGAASRSRPATVPGVASTLPGADPPADLVRQMQGALARVRLNQLASLPVDDSGRQTWQLDLPVLNDDRIDAFRLRVQRGPEHASGKKHAVGWTLDLSFDLSGLGPIHTHLHLRQESISSSFWTERKDTGQLLARHLEELRAGFARAGLEVGNLSIHQGRPPAQADPAIGAPLLSEQA